MKTLIGFSLLWLAWGALVSLLNVLVWCLITAVAIDATIVARATVIASGIVVRRLLSRRAKPAQAITPPIVCGR